ncbi:MAG: 50S ribosomal protein L30 [Candidatus Diapherotrites archaeon]
MFAVIRIRGSVDLNSEKKKTLEFLRLDRVNHLVLVPQTASIKGMVKKVEDTVTFGEINDETIGKLIEKRGRMQGDKIFGTAGLKKAAGKAKDFKELGLALLQGRVSLKELGLKPVFRLRPPRKGFERKGIKRNFSIGGAAGYRGTEINKLIEKMI